VARIGELREDGLYHLAMEDVWRRVRRWARRRRYVWISSYGIAKDARGKECIAPT